MCKEAAEERGSAKLEKVAGAVADWLEDADAATTNVADYAAKKRELEAARTREREQRDRDREERGGGSRHLGANSDLEGGFRQREGHGR